MARATREWMRRLGKEYTRLTGWISHTAARFHTMTQEHISHPSFLSGTLPTPHSSKRDERHPGNEMIALALFDLFEKRMLRSSFRSTSCQGRRACVHPSMETSSAHRSSSQPAVHDQSGVLGLNRRCRPQRRTSECEPHPQRAESHRAPVLARHTSPEGL